MKFLNLLKKPINTYKMYKTVRAENPTMSRRQALEAVDYKLDPTRVSIYEDAMYGVDKVGFKGYTEEEVKQIQSTPEGREKLNKAYKEQQEMLSKMKKGVAAVAVVATQTPFQRTERVKSKGVRSSNATLSGKSFKKAVENMARQTNANKRQLDIIDNMNGDNLKELYNEKPYLFDMYFSYDRLDDGYDDYEEGDAGVEKVIQEYEAKFGRVFP